MRCMSPRGLKKHDLECGSKTRIGERMPDLFEQVLLQQDGFALILLVADTANQGDDDEEDEDDRRTSKERLNARLARRSG